MGTAGKGEGGTSRAAPLRTGCHVCTTPSQPEATVRHREPRSVVCDSLDGWGGEGKGGAEREGYMMHISGSRCCMVETNTAL